MRVAIYVRVSTQEQAKEGYSVGEQEKRLRKYCEAKDWTVHKVYVDGGFSGANMERPALQNIIKDTREKRFDAVLTFKLDRLSRSQKDTLSLIEDIFLPNGVNFVSMTENFDTSTSFGRAMVGILAVFAQLERDQIKERMAIGVEGRAKEGKWNGAAYSPVGYSYENDELHIIEYEAMLVRSAYDLFVNRVPVNTICREFEKKGYRHRYGYWSAPTLKNTLKNKIYAGYISYHGEYSKGLHEPIISLETWEQAQRIFAERDQKNPEYKNAFQYNSALGGILWCKRCGARYCKQFSHKLVSGEEIMIYTCYSRSKKSRTMVKDPNCRNKNWRMEQLEKMVFNEIEKLALDPSYIDEIRETPKDDEQKSKIELIEKQIRDITARISNLTDLYSLGLDMEEVKGKIDPLIAERDKLRNELAALRKGSSMTTDQAFRIAQSFGDALIGGNLDDIRFVVNELIDKIVIDGEKVTIHWAFA